MQTFAAEYLHRSCRVVLLHLWLRLSVLLDWLLLDTIYVLFFYYITFVSNTGILWGFGLECRFGHSIRTCQNQDVARHSNGSIYTWRFSKPSPCGRAKQSKHSNCSDPPLHCLKEAGLPRGFASDPAFHYCIQNIYLQLGTSKSCTLNEEHPGFTVPTYCRNFESWNAQAELVSEATPFKSPLYIST